MADDKADMAADPPKKRAAFDDVLKFGRYTLYLTLLFFLLLTVQSLQLLFMGFAGASPKIAGVLCNGSKPEKLSDEMLKNVAETCEYVAKLEKTTGVSCEIKMSYKYGAIHKRFNVECDPDRVHHITSYQFIGLVFGTLFSGYLANKFGRKYTLMADLALLALSLLLSTFSTNVLMFIVSRFFVMTFTAGSHNVAHLFIIENLPPKWRSIIPTYLSYPVGFLLTAIIANLCQNWLVLTYVSAAITLLPLMLLTFAVETPSFLFGRGNVSESKKSSGEVRLESKGEDPTETLLKQKGIACRKKARQAALRCETFFFSEKSNDFDAKWKAAAIQQRINEVASKMAAEDAPARGSGIPISPLFKDKRLVCFTAILSYCIIILSTVTYGVIGGISDIPGEIWVNLALSAIVSYLCNWLAISAELICGKLNRPMWSGRRQLHVAFALLTVLLLIALTMVQYTGKATPENPGWQWVVRLLAWSIVGTCTELYIIHHVQSSETFPTPVRATGCSIVQTASRIGNVFSGFLITTKKYGIHIPFAIMTVVFTSELLLYLQYSYGLCCQNSNETAVIRETKGKSKPEFMANEGKGKSFDEYVQSVKLTEEDLAEFDDTST